MERLTFFLLLYFSAEWVRIFLPLESRGGVSNRIPLGQSKQNASFTPLPKTSSYTLLGSFKVNTVNIRSGPDLHYPVAWSLEQARNWPVKILRTYHLWAYIEDAKGCKGWVKMPALSSRVFVLVAHDHLPLYGKENTTQSHCKALLGQCTLCEIKKPKSKKFSTLLGLTQSEWTPIVVPAPAPKTFLEKLSSFFVRPLEGYVQTAALWPFSPMGALQSGINKHPAVPQNTPRAPNLPADPGHRAKAL